MDSFTRRRVSRLFPVLVFGAGALVSWTALPIPASAATTSPTSLLAASEAAIAKQSAVHVAVMIKSSPTAAVENVTGDWGKTGGTETVSLGKALLVVKAIGGFAYLSGNSSGLTKIFGFTAALAKKIGKHWVSYSSKTSQYGDLAPGLKISSAKGVLPKAKGTKLSTEVVKNTKMFVLKWTVAESASAPELKFSLLIPAVGIALPLEETVSTTTGGKETITFSKWGEHVVVSAPPADMTVASTKITG
ncbi:MAG: hypothetical protein ABSA31_06070 [Acidimicrobiales bacterium]|jgi:hypothetical protein